MQLEIIKDKIYRRKWQNFKYHPRDVWQTWLITDDNMYIYKCRKIATVFKHYTILILKNETVNI